MANNNDKIEEVALDKAATPKASMQGTEPKPRNAALELCIKFQHRARFYRDRRLRRAKAKRNDYKDPANW